MEVVDGTGSQMNEGVGSILATSLHNYAMPFIRYDTGDLGCISEDVCSCGRDSRLLENVIGRQHVGDMLQTPEGKFIHGMFIDMLFDRVDKVTEFQIIQTKIDKIIIKIVPKDGFDEKQLDMIREIINRKSNQWSIEFRFVDKIERTNAGKYKFIISELI
jgi:phenylacetate-CoA ligase